MTEIVEGEIDGTVHAMLLTQEIRLGKKSAKVYVAPRQTVVHGTVQHNIKQVITTLQVAITCFLFCLKQYVEKFVMQGLRQPVLREPKYQYPSCVRGWLRGRP